MASKEEIIVMSKLAIYDKNYGENDKKINALYYRDYVYRKNFYARSLALLGSLIIIMLYASNILLNEEIDLFLIDFRSIAITAVKFIAALMVLYTVVGARISTVEYRKVKRRIKSYFLLIKSLEELREKPEIDDDSDFYEPDELNESRVHSSEEELKLYYGSNTRNKRSDY